MTVRESTARPLVVVGYDGSDGSRAALAWAADYAVKYDADLKLVCAAHWPITYGYPVLPLSMESPEDGAKELLDKAVTDLTLPPERVRTSVVVGPPAPELLRAARGSDLLVVGSRGHGGFTGLLVGSVSTYCVHHADVPVVVVR